MATKQPTFNFEEDDWDQMDDIPNDDRELVPMESVYQLQF